VLSRARLGPDGHWGFRLRPGEHVSASGIGSRRLCLFSRDRDGRYGYHGALAMKDRCSSFQYSGSLPGGGWVPLRGKFGVRGVWGSYDCR
jgi:hypothetical protein